jgi:hypothetical protein
MEHNQGKRFLSVAVLAVVFGIVLSLSIVRML